MTDAKQLDGQCLCGAVQVRITPPDPVLEVCHCTMCRRWAGGPAVSLRLVSDPQIEGGDHVVRYRSSDWAERAFCRTCGTHLFYYYAPKDGYSFGAGLFDGADGFALAEEIFIDEKPAGYAFLGAHVRLTGAEVLAKAGLSDA